jgi:hypothetical protein
MRFYIEMLGGALLLLGWFMLLSLLSLVPDEDMWARIMEVLS